MATEINVLHVLNSAHGGSALSTFQLIEELKKRGVNSSLVCFDNASEIQRRTIGSIVDQRVLFIPLYWTNKRIRVKWWKRPLLEIYTFIKTYGGYKFQKRIQTLIKEQNIHIVHTSTLVNPEGAIAAKKNNLPHVWHARELIGPTAHYHFWNYKRWSNYVLQHSSVLVANSLVTQDNLRKYFPADSIRYIPNGICVDQFQVKEHRNSTKPLIIGMVGNVTSKWKNHDFFIQTASLFKDRNGVEFHIYGELPSEDDGYLIQLRKRVDELNLHKIVYFKGHRGNVHEIMAGIDILFHPTGLESFGRIFIEAMAGGIPIVAANEGGALELVRDGRNGFRVPENDIKASSEAIQKMIDSHDLRNAMGKQGRDIVEAEYSLTQLSDKLYHLYNGLVNY